VPIHSGNSFLNVFQYLNSYWKGQAWRAEDAINGRCGRLGTSTIASEDFPRGGSREPKRSCLLIECDETRSSQRDLNFSKFDRASCLRCRNGVADLANFCGLSPPRWAQGSAFGRAWSSLGAPVWHAKFSAYSVGSDVALVGAKPLSGRGHARTQSDPRKYRGSSKSNYRCAVHGKYLLMVGSPWSIARYHQEP